MLKSRLKLMMLHLTRTFPKVLSSFTRVRRNLLLPYSKNKTCISEGILWDILFKSIFSVFRVPIVCI